MIELYGHPFSSYTWKARIALHAVGADYELRVLDGPDPALRAFVAKAHPAGKFPVLADDGKVVVEATAIVEYLAMRFPAAGLIPADPHLAVETRMIDRVFDNYLMANMNRIVSAWFVDRDDGLSGLRKEPDAQEVAKGRQGLLRAYRWLEEWLGANALPPHVSLVTCAAAPSLFYADWVERIPADCPRVAALRAELVALDEVRRCIDEARPFRHYFPPGAPDRD